MAGSSNITTEHETIRKWAEERNGKPASVVGTGDKDDAGLLRIDFPGRRGKGSLKEISWEEFFEKFEEKNLAFLFQDKTAGGKTSRFSKIISRDSVGIEDKNNRGMNESGNKKSDRSMSSEGMDEYAALFNKEMEELQHIAEEKHIPHPDEFNKEELVMAIELADLAEK